MQGTWVRLGVVTAVALADLAVVGGGKHVTAAPSITIGAASAAPAWTALFNRTSGWTGADDGYSIPISGRYTSGPTAQSQTMFVYADTFIGTVGANGQRQSGSTFVHNTLAGLHGGNPNPADIRFFWHTNAQSQPGPVFVPSTPDAQKGDYYWSADGIVLNNTVNLFMLRTATTGSGPFDFVTRGVNLLQWPVGDPNPGRDAVQLDTPLTVPALGTVGQLTMGAAILANTTQSGAPFPDGYIYVYGVRADPLNVKAVVARFLPANIANFSAWSYWTGSGWSSNIASAAPIADRMSHEYSVTALSDGEYMMIFQLDGISDDTAYRLAPTPEGPWSAPVKIWHCPEQAMRSGVYCYNAKAHPELSQPGQLLISYNVNTTSLVDDYRCADIYHPRFITLPVSALP